jgi:hypothetical protein
MDHRYSFQRTPSQNGVVKRKNRSLQEMIRTIINEQNLPHVLWTEATTQHVIQLIGSMLVLN